MKWAIWHSKSSDTSVAIPSLFVKSSYPTIPLEPLLSEGVLKEDRDSGWRDSDQQKPIPAF